jgi:[acyl-carrier-protein] S-malonyltransferase
MRGLLMQDTITDGTCMRAIIIEPGKLEEVSRLVEEVQSQLPKGEVAELANINSKSQVCLDY